MVRCSEWSAISLLISLFISTPTDFYISNACAVEGWFRSIHGDKRM